MLNSLFLFLISFLFPVNKCVTSSAFFQFIANIYDFHFKFSHKLRPIFYFMFQKLKVYKNCGVKKYTIKNLILHIFSVFFFMYSIM